MGTDCREGALRVPQGAENVKLYVGAGLVF
jgi:hypothetical protein